MNRIQIQAQKAIDAGYVFVSSVVKRFRYTTYYHYVPLSSIMRVGEWIPAPIGCYQNHAKDGYWRGRYGVSHLPEKTISKEEMYRL